MNFDNFDTDDIANMGRPRFFNVEHYLETVRMMVAADEVKQALHMLDNLPGWFRDNEPFEVTRLRVEILSRCQSLSDYANDTSESYEQTLAKERRHYPEMKELSEKFDFPFCQPRGTIILETIKEYNARGVWPHLHEFGPADYWLPHGLIAKDAMFTYTADSINLQTKAEAYKKLKTLKPNFIGLSDKPSIFVCCEVLEHLWNEGDIKHNYSKFVMDNGGLIPEIIILSTPKYTLLGGVPYDSKPIIEHVQTFTPKEFIAFAETNFSGYNWFHCDADMQVLKGVLK